jgi:AcrR family transcriptional regulator
LDQCTIFDTMVYQHPSAAHAPQAEHASTVAPIVRRPKVRERNRRRVLDAARALVAVGGMDALSMRTLADRAGVSATTLYNLFGTKDEVVRVLATDILGALDAAFVDLVDPDPVEQVRAHVLLLVEHVIDRAPPSLVAAVLEDAVLTEQINAQWASRSLVEDAIREAMRKRKLRDDIDAAVLAEHVRAGLLHQQRLWAAAVIDDATYRAAAAYCVDLSLLAVARGATRDRLLAYVREDERVLRPSVVERDR